MGSSLGVVLCPSKDMVSVASSLATSVKKDFKNVDISFFADFQVNTGAHLGVFSLPEMSFFSGTALCFTFDDIVYAKSRKNNIDPHLLYMGQGVDLINLFEYTTQYGDINILSLNENFIEESERIFKCEGKLVDQFLKEKLG